MANHGNNFFFCEVFPHFPQENNVTQTHLHLLQTAALTHSLQTLDRDITSHALMGSVGLRFFVFSILAFFFFKDHLATFVEGCMLVFGCGSLVQKIHTSLDLKMLVMLVRTYETCWN